MAKLISVMERGSHSLVTSALTVGEILVQPLRLKRSDLQTQYLEAFQQSIIVAFDLECAQLFAELRALHPSLRPPDAIQLSCAMSASCDLFLTNDQRLSNIRCPGGMKVYSLEKWTQELIS